MKTIISILDSNGLFDNNLLKIQVNKKENFLESYKFNPTSYNPFPKNIKRNSDGYIMLDELPYIISDLKTYTRKKSFWMILDNGSRIFVKEENEDEMENELLFQELCKILNIPCANYDIGLLNSNKYLISNSFLALDEVIYDYYRLGIKSYLDVDKLLVEAERISQDQFLRKTLTIDGLVKNVDRFPKNFRAIMNKSNCEIKLCPLFDNGLRDKYKVTMPFIGKSTNNDKILEYLMQDKTYKNWIEEYILTKDIPNIKEIIQNEKKIYIDSKTYEVFETNLHEGKQLIKKVYKNS